MFVLFVLLFSSLVLIFIFKQKRYKYWNERGFLSAPTIFPFGSLKGFGTEFPTFVGLDGYYKSFKGKTQAVGIYFFLSPTLMIMDLELLKNVFIRDFTSFHDRGFYYNKVDDPLSANLVRS